MRPIDGDALLETVEDHVTTVSCCPTVDWSMGKTQMKKQIIEDICNAQTIGGWISVKDRLPEQAGYRCLVSAEYGDGKHTVFTAFTGYGEPGWWTYESVYMEKVRESDNRVHHNYHITHWMPMPEAEKDGDA